MRKLENSEDRNKRRPGLPAALVRQMYAVSSPLPDVAEFTSAADRIHVLLLKSHTSRHGQQISTGLST